MKLAIEGYIKKKVFDEISTIWNKLWPFHGCMNFYE
jgi:hypothetical protein